ALVDEALDQPAVLAPRPREPAGRLGLRRDDRRADAGDDELREVRLRVGLRNDLVPAGELGGVDVAAVSRLEDEVAADDGAAAFERLAQGLQLARPELELGLEVVERRWAGRREMPQERGPGRVRALHPRELGAADRVE